MSRKRLHGVAFGRSGFGLKLLVVLLISDHAHGAPKDSSVADGREAPSPDLDRAGARVAQVPDLAASDSVSLGGILAFADLHSPVLLVARSTRSRAEAARVAASLLLPSNPELTVAAGPRVGLTGTSVDVDLSLMQQIQIAGERGVRLDAAARMREMTDAEVEQIRWLVHCDVHAAFHLARVEQERVQLAERVLTFQQEVLQVVERQISAGETAPLTLRLAQAEVAQTRQVLVAAEQALLSSRIRLAQLAGWPVVSPPTPGGTVETPPRDPPTIQQLLAVARERLPSLRAGAASVREAQARVAVADREGWPRPSLGVQYRREGSPTNEGPSSILMGVVSIPIPSFQTNQGERARTRSDVSIAAAELKAIVLLLEGQIAEARSEAVAAMRRTESYGIEILPRFEENLTLLRRSFELGEIDILALSTGRERFLRIQSDALAAQLDYYVALAGLERVVGVDFWHDDLQEEGTR